MTSHATGHPPEVTAPGTTPSPLLVTATLCLGSLSGALMQSLVIPIQSELPRLLGTAPGNASWAVTATLLAAAVTMPVTGRLADMYGKKRILVISATILVGGSVVAALADSLIIFILGRVMQGVAIGYIPVAISLVRKVTPVGYQTTAVAALSATMGVGSALGLPLSAWIADAFSWHALFWFSAALAALVLVTTLLVVPTVQPEAQVSRLDVPGLIGLAVGLSGVLVGVSKGSEWGWTSPTTVIFIPGGFLVLLVWGFHELRTASPMIDLRTAAYRPVLFTNLAAMLVGFGMMAQSIIVPQLMQLPSSTGYGLGQSVLAAGLWMAPAGLTMMALSPVSSLMISGIGARVTLAVGAVIVSTGYVAAVMMMDASWKLMVAGVMSAAGVGVAFAAMPTLIMDNVPSAEAGAGVGVNALMRSIGTTVAGAVMTAILTGNTMDLDGRAVPNAEAFRLCFIVGALASLAGALVVLLVPRQEKAVPPSTVQA